MSTVPPSGPKGPGHPESMKPKPDAEAKKIPGGARMLDSPFAKMFAASGAMPTAKEMHAIMNGILMQAVHEIKRSDKQWKAAMKKLKRQLEGNE